MKSNAKSNMMSSLFLTNVTEYVGEEACFMHQGMTSSDILDTTFAVQLQQSADIMLADLDKLLAALKNASLSTKTLCIGRSHGIHAEPTTFGIKLVGHYAPPLPVPKTPRIRPRRNFCLCHLRRNWNIRHGWSSDWIYVAEKNWDGHRKQCQPVIPRDRHAMFFSVMGVLASAVKIWR